MDSDSPKPAETADLNKLSEAEWEQLAQETFAERKEDVGRVPDRRRPSAPVWYPESK